MHPILLGALYKLVRSVRLQGHFRKRNSQNLAHISAGAHNSTFICDHFVIKDNRTWIDFFF